MRVEQLLSRGGAVIDDTGMHPALEVRRRAAAVERSLRAAGLRRNDRIALIAENGAEFIACVFGILRAGATVVPIDPGLPNDAVNHALGTTAPQCAIVGARKAAMLTSAPSSRLRVFHVEDVTAADRATEPSTDAIDPEAHDTDPAFVLFSSGTTGQPKRVILSHRAVIATTEAVADYLRPTPADRLYISRSMTHGSAIVGELLVALSCGADLIARNPLIHASQFFRDIAEHRATILCIPTSLLTFFATPLVEVSRLRSVHTIHFSGAIVNGATVTKVAEKFTWISLINGYGLTEAGPRVAQSGAATVRKPGTVGRPIRGASIEVRSDKGVRRSTHEVGELYVRSPGLMDAYLDDEDLTTRTLVDGWLATGDLGYVDDDGDFFVVGRKDDLIVTGCHNVVPGDVEAVVLQAPDIQDCVVFGVADALLGQRIVCVYSTQAPEAERRRLVETIRRLCARQLAGYQIPKHFHAWDTIPGLPGGKARRQLTRDQFLRQAAAV